MVAISFQEEAALPSSPRPGGRTDLDAGVVAVRLATRQVGQQDVLRFQVSVDDSFGLEDAHGPCDLLQENPNGVLAQCPFT